jgi:hypothetical protein
MPEDRLRAVDDQDRHHQARIFRRDHADLAPPPTRT